MGKEFEKEQIHVYVKKKYVYLTFKIIVMIKSYKVRKAILKKY